MALGDINAVCGCCERSISVPKSHVTILWNHGREDGTVSYPCPACNQITIRTQSAFWLKALERHGVPSYGPAVFDPRPEAEPLTLADTATFLEALYDHERFDAAVRALGGAA